jgi:peptidoglycan/xylan/chitin deacetylase (PgdA/CDA1 family)
VSAHAPATPAGLSSLRAGLCVLTLHGIEHKPGRDHDITWPAFARLLDVIAARRLTIRAHLTSESALTEPAVVLTFDDGTADHAEVAEELAQRGIAAIFFVSAGRHGGGRYLTRAGVRRLAQMGHVVGCHGFDHRRLDGEMTEADIRREIGDSKRLLEDVAGARVEYFAPPGGFGFDGMDEMLRRHGYLASRGMDWGFYRTPATPWAVPCLPVTELTLRLGWIAAALQRWQMPHPMRWAAVVKQRLPERIRIAMRCALHRLLRKGS